MKKKRYQMRRKTKAIIGIIVCLVLLFANIALRDYTLTKNTLLEHMADYHSTGELEKVMELPRLSLKGTDNHQFYLMENENCFAMMSVQFNLFHGWLDGPCLIVEKDETKPLDIAYNSFSSADDEDKEQMRIIGRINDESISYVEVEINYATAGANQTLEKTTMKTDKYIEYDGQRYFFMESIRVLGLSEHIVPPLIANAYNADGELVCTQEINIGQGTSMG